MSVMKPPEEQKRILVPYDPWDASTNALQHAVRRVAKTGESLHIVYVADEDVNAEQVKKQAEDDMRATDVTESVDYEFEVLRPGSGMKGDAAVADRLIQQIGQHEYELVIMGYAENQGTVQKLMFGSVTDELLNEVDTPLTLVPGAR